MTRASTVRLLPADLVRRAATMLVALCCAAALLVATEDRAHAIQNYYVSVGINGTAGVHRGAGGVTFWRNKTTFNSKFRLQDWRKDGWGVQGFFLVKATGGAIGWTGRKYWRGGVSTQKYYDVTYRRPRKISYVRPFVTLADNGVEKLRNAHDYPLDNPHTN